MGNKISQVTRNWGTKTTKCSIVNKVLELLLTRIATLWVSTFPVYTYVVHTHVDPTNLDLNTLHTLSVLSCVPRQVTECTHQCLPEEAWWLSWLGEGSVGTVQQQKQGRAWKGGHCFGSLNLQVQKPVTMHLTPLHCTHCLTLHPHNIEYTYTHKHTQTHTHTCTYVRMHKHTLP